MFKRFLCICVLNLAVLMTACGANKTPASLEDSTYWEKYKDLTAEEIPDMNTFQTLVPEEKVALRLAMDRIPNEDYETVFSQVITDYCESDAVPECVDSVELKEVTVEKDDLSLISGQNQKPLDNLIVNIDLKMEAVDPLEYVNAGQENQSMLYDYFHRATGAFSKILCLTVCATSEQGNSDKLTYPIEKIGGNQENVYASQPEAEYALQTLAFDFAKKNSDFTLTKFGARPESEDLYIEYLVEDDYLYDTTDSMEKREASIAENIEKLDEIRTEILDHVLSAEEAKAYMEEHGLTACTVAFRNGTWEGEYQIFRVEYPN